MKRDRILLSKEYWFNALEFKDFNKTNNFDFAQEIVDKMKELLVIDRTQDGI